jgi:CPA1 family monovalent cation:H+ antiporter
MPSKALPLLVLMVAAIGLHVLAYRIGVPYPILLVFGGMALGFVPGIPAIGLSPDLVLLVFLPPLLYASGFFSSTRDLRAYAPTISVLAVVLVLVTMVVVAVTAHAVVADLSWPVAFTLGAIVSPTDPLAATTIAGRLGVPRRVISVLEGEGLFNDATALVAVRVTVAAAFGDAAVAGRVASEFLLGAGGGALIGLAVGWLVAEARRRAEDPIVEISLSLVAAYGAYLPAERLGVSGVLAALVSGVYLGWRVPTVASAASRLLGRPFWQMLVYLFNAALFVMIGLQLRPMLARVTSRPTTELIALASILAAVVLITRVVWGFTVQYLIRLLDRRPSRAAHRIPARQRLVIAWSGMRGAVSLAIALSLPGQTSAGGAFPNRELVILLTFGVVLATLVVPGLTLPFLIRGLKVHDDGRENQEEIRARLAATEAALVRLEELAAGDWSHEDAIERLEDTYQYRRHDLSAQAGVIQDDDHQSRSLAERRLARELIDAQRRTILRLRSQGMINSDVMNRIERDLDLEYTLLER